MTCEIEGCIDEWKKRVPRRGNKKVCRMHYQRFRRNGTFDLLGRGRSRSTAEFKLWSKVEFPRRDAVIDCWLWTGCKTWEGHGQLSICHKTRSVRRIVFGEFVAEVPRENLVVDTCFEPACVNPFHLLSVTRSEAIMRKQDVAP
jgi:hypothetical protein